MDCRHWYVNIMWVHTLQQTIQHTATHCNTRHWYIREHQVSPCEGLRICQTLYCINQSSVKDNREQRSQ